MAVRALSRPILRSIKVYPTMIRSLQHRCFSSAPAMAHSAAALRRKAIDKGAPPSIAAVGEDGSLVGDRAVFIRPVGCTRRIFLLKPAMTADEMEGLAYRIRTLTKNEAINSILIATDDTDDAENGALPSSLLDLDSPFLHHESVDEGFAPQPGMTWHVAAGYDPLELYQSGAYQNPEAVDALLTHLMDLTLAVRGDQRTTKIPTIVVPHGALTDGGYWLGMASYVMATRETSFRNMNPSRGLSLDPIGLSYLLPRLGQEFGQPAAEYSGVGMILGLTGMEATAEDMMETGLATHFMESPTTLGSLERTLAELPPWNQQGLLKQPVRFLGQPTPVVDHNAQFRNVAVADAVHCFSSYRADGVDMWDYDDETAYIAQDPSLDPDPVPWHDYRSSDLVDYAATFNDIFTSETTAEGILERFREIASRTTTDDAEQEGIDVAASLVKGMERQSPLAVSVVHRLLTLGSSPSATLKTCMEREKRAQAKMFAKADFKEWAKSASKHHDGEFGGWKHKSLSKVSPDEIAEIVEA